MRSRNHLLAAAVAAACGAEPPGPRPPPTPGVDVDERFRVEYVTTGHPNYPADGEGFRIVDGVAFVREADRGKIEALQRRKKARREYGDRHR